MKFKFSQKDSKYLENLLLKFTISDTDLALAPVIENCWNLSDLSLTCEVAPSDWNTRRMRVN